MFDAEALEVKALQFFGAGVCIRYLPALALPIGVCSLWYAYPATPKANDEVGGIEPSFQRLIRFASLVGLVKPPHEKMQDVQQVDAFMGEDHWCGIISNTLNESFLYKYIELNSK